MTDTKTGLMWQQGEPGSLTWAAALSYCEGLALGGQTDWRLPNIKELESITDDSRYNPAIDTTYFPNAAASFYWSSTSGADSGVWDVGFGTGCVYNDCKCYNYYVRCVRAGLTGPLFKDVPAGYWAENFIYSIYNAGITSGCGNDNFCPETPVSRAMMAVFMLRALGEQPAATCSETKFADVYVWAVPRLFCVSIEKFSELGITSGCQSDNPATPQNEAMFCPDSLVTRAQMAVFLTKGFLH